jgi:hypothetical protein
MKMEFEIEGMGAMTVVNRTTSHSARLGDKPTEEKRPDGEKKPDGAPR